MTGLRKARRAPAAAPPAKVEVQLAPIIDAFSRHRGVEVEPGWGAGNLVLKLDGKIFCLLATTGLVAKLPESRVDELVIIGAGTRFDPRNNGRVMKEWLAASAGSDWLALAHEAYAFAQRNQRVARTSTRSPKRRATR